MNNTSLKAFLITLILYGSVFAYVYNLETIKIEKTNFDKRFNLPLHSFQKENRILEQTSKKVKKKIPQKKIKKQKNNKIQNSKQIKQSNNLEVIKESLTKNASNTQITIFETDEIFKKIKKEIHKHIIYPKKAKRMHQEDVVKIEFIVHEDSLERFTIIKKSRFSSLNEAAINAIKNANFKFVKKRLKMTLDIKFDIEN